MQWRILTILAVGCGCAAPQQGLAPLGQATPGAQQEPPAHDPSLDVPPAEGSYASQRGVDGQLMAGLVRDADANLSPLYFAFNSDALAEDARERLAEMARYLAGHAGISVTVSGHCDGRGTAEYNLALGERRARVARDFLTRMGVQAERIRVLSYGSEHPAEVGHGEAVWAKNRRAEFQARDTGRSARSNLRTP